MTSWNDNPKNATIKSTMLGREDHGILTFSVILEGQGMGVSYGGYVLDGPDSERKGERVHYPLTGECVSGILQAVGVDRWENLRGKNVRAYFNNGGGWGTRCVAIGHIIEDRWFTVVNKQGKVLTFEAMVESTQGK